MTAKLRHLSSENVQGYLDILGYPDHKKYPYEFYGRLPIVEGFDAYLYTHTLKHINTRLVFFISQDKDMNIRYDNFNIHNQSGWAITALDFIRNFHIKSYKL